MSKVKIKLNKSEVRGLLKSPEIAASCKEQADAVAGRAGEGYSVEQRNYPERTGYVVSAESKEAGLDNMRHNTLLKALGI
ncbi:hypothetical protein SAMN02745687_00919 [Lachnospiraceae bacterium NK3A20]|nr:hypothetical protein SAMN02745687_00919 [Lachnospiraceae bacterium NK3A20]